MERPRAARYNPRVLEFQSHHREGSGGQNQSLWPLLPLLFTHQGSILGWWKEPRIRSPRFCPWEATPALSESPVLYLSSGDSNTCLRDWLLDLNPL